MYNYVHEKVQGKKITNPNFDLRNGIIAIQFQRS